MGLGPAYLSGGVVKTIVKMLIALALLPADRIYEGFQVVQPNFILFLKQVFIFFFSYSVSKRKMLTPSCKSQLRFGLESLGCIHITVDTGLEPKGPKGSA